MLRTTAVLLLIVVMACARRAEPPSPDRPASRPPDMTGASVMVLPAQPAPGETVATDGEAVPGLDREVAYWLGEMVPRVTWAFPPALERALARSPSLGIRLRSLAVSAFHRAQVENIGDPLFGDLRALGALVDARYALVPVAAGWVPDSAGTGRVEVRAALIDTRGGSVLWFGAVAGDAGPYDSPGAVASAAQALARQFAR